MCANASNVRLVNLIIHDTGHGTYIENPAHNIEIYGWIVYNGGNDNSSRSDGHGIYVRNDGTTPKLIADNVIFNQFGFGIHSYAEGGRSPQTNDLRGETSCSTTASCRRSTART